MIVLRSTDTLRLTPSSAAALDVTVDYMDCSQGTAGSVNPIFTPPDWQFTQFSSAVTATICAAPSGSGGEYRRNVKRVNIRNTSAATPCDVLVFRERSSTAYSEAKFTLNGGEILSFVEGIGWFVTAGAQKLDVKLRVVSDVTFATTSWADVTGLTAAVEAGKHYGFQVHLMHIENASTTGARFGVNGPTATAVRLGGAGVYTGSLTAAVMFAATADVAAYDTSVVGVTTASTATPQVASVIYGGWVQTSAAGTFAVRAQSEVAVAAGITVKVGSWMRLWEFDN